MLWRLFLTTHLSAIKLCKFNGDCGHLCCSENPLSDTLTWHRAIMLHYMKPWRVMKRIMCALSIGSAQLMIVITPSVLANLFLISSCCWLASSLAQTPFHQCDIKMFALQSHAENNKPWSKVLQTACIWIVVYTFVSHKKQQTNRSLPCPSQVYCKCSVHLDQGLRSSNLRRMYGGFGVHFSPHRIIFCLFVVNNIIFVHTTINLKEKTTPNKLIVDDDDAQKIWKMARTHYSKTTRNTTRRMCGSNSPNLYCFHEIECRICSQEPVLVAKQQTNINQTTHHYQPNDQTTTSSVQTTSQVNLLSHQPKEKNINMNIR